MTPEERVAERFRDGRSGQQCAHETGMTLRFVQRIYRDLIKSYEWTPARLSVLNAMWRDAHSPQQIAVSLRCCPALVTAKAKELKLWRKNYVAKPETAPKVKRNCMCCEKSFQSEGAHNRLCADCRQLRNIDYVTPHLRGAGAY